jgi:hypothetical protein
MSLAPGALSGMQVAVLDFPYSEAFDSFLAGLKRVLGLDQLELWQYPPYRLLNNAIAACAPTVVHGFERYGEGRSQVRRMVAVGRPVCGDVVLSASSSLRCPPEESIAQLIRLWVQICGDSACLLLCIAF